MNKPVNTLKETKKDAGKRRDTGRKIARGTHMILDGAFFSRHGNGWLKVFFVLALLGLFYISNNYLAEKKIRKIEKINRHIKELKFDFVQTRASLMEISRPSVVAERLNKYGIKPLTQPPEKIFLKTKNQPK
jgi:hypothetical protein